MREKDVKKLSRLVYSILVFDYVGSVGMDAGIAADDNIDRL